MTHEYAIKIVQEMDIIGPSHGSVHDDYDRVRRALDRQPDAVAAMNALDHSKMEETPQGAAAHRGCHEILRLFIERGVQMDLFMAAAMCKDDLICETIDRNPQAANALGAHGIHLLNHAGSKATARTLLNRGSDPNYIVYTPCGWTPAHEAAAQGRLDILKELAQHCPCCIAAAKGTTPLHAAARGGHLETIRWMLNQDIPAFAIGTGSCWEGKTPRQLAVENGHWGAAELFNAMLSAAPPPHSSALSSASGSISSRSVKISTPGGGMN